MDSPFSHSGTPGTKRLLGKVRKGGAVGQRFEMWVSLSHKQQEMMIYDGFYRKYPEFYAYYVITHILYTYIYIYTDVHCILAIK